MLLSGKMGNVKKLYISNYSNGNLSYDAVSVVTTGEVSSDSSTSLHYIVDRIGGIAELMMGVLIFLIYIMHIYSSKLLKL